MKTHNQQKPFLIDLSNKTSLLSKELSKKILLKNSIILENCRLKQAIEKEIISHQQSIDIFQEEIKILDLESISKAIDLKKKKQEMIEKKENLHREIAENYAILINYRKINKEKEYEIQESMKEYNHLHEIFSTTIKNNEGAAVTFDNNDREFDNLKEKLKKANEILDYNSKKKIYLENKLKNSQKLSSSLKNLLHEKHTLELFNQSLKEKLNSSINSSNPLQNYKKSLKTNKPASDVNKYFNSKQKFETYFKKLKKLHY